MFVFGCTGSLLLPEGFSLVVASGGYSQVAGLGLLNAVASLGGAQASGHAGSGVVAHRLRDGFCVSSIFRQIQVLDHQESL